MKCPNCGTENPEGSAFCGKCGTPLKTGQSSDHVADHANQPTGNPGSNGQMGHPLITTKRGMIKFVIFSIITLGIYDLYFYHAMARDLNIICEGDGNKTAGLIQYLLLSFITCGIYSLYWYYKFANRVRDNAPRYGVMITEGGGTVLLWMIFGSLLCGVGFFISIYIFIRNFNILAMAYNVQQ